MLWFVLYLICLVSYISRPKDIRKRVTNLAKNQDDP